MASVLTTVESSDQPPRSASHATVVDCERADAPSQAALERSQQHPQLDAGVQARIGRQLRAVYHEILSEPVPDRFVRLLDELATKAADRR